MSLFKIYAELRKMGLTRKQAEKIIDMIREFAVASIKSHLLLG